MPRLSLRAFALLFGLPASSLPAQQRSTTLPRTTADSVRPARAGVGTIDGIVTDTSLRPIQAADISILRTSLRIGTGPNGRFRITQVPAGQYLLIVRRVGYRPASAIVEVRASDTLRLSYALDRLPVNLDTVVVAERRLTVRMAEFEQRRRVGFGQFLTEEEIAKRNSVYATELFRRFTAVNVAPDRTSVMTAYYALSKREGANPALGSCPMKVIVDYVPMPTPFNLELLPSPRDLAGIEVYAANGVVPPQFAGFNTGCGVILVWTKGG